MSASIKIQRRAEPFDAANWSPEMPAIIQQIYANRGVHSKDEMDRSLSGLISPMQLGGIERVVEILSQAIVDQRYITIAGDYDCDGATGTSVGVRGLRLLGLPEDRIKFIIPNRDKHGYGLSVGLIDDMPQPTDIILTVDSGVASVEGVAYAKAKGYTVVITDHHLPGDVLPEPDAMVNPNLKGDPFPSKMLAGVGVMFYVLMAVRMRLKEIGHPGGAGNLAEVLDLVAVGTVADLVPLDRNNRILVAAGLHRIQNGLGSVGVNTLINVAAKDYRYFTTTDIAFAVAPRLNSAGRLADMTLGVQLLICKDSNKALRLAAVLEDINKERKEVQAEMTMTAESIVALAPPGDDMGVVVYGPTWHHGVVGLVASKLKESLYRPTVAFAPAFEGSPDARGSARSIPGLHLRDVLALVEARNPGILPKFGGHAMAAGMSISVANIPRFKDAFNEVLKELVTPEMLESVIASDGELLPEQMNPRFTRYMEACGPWGQGFPKPIFDGVFEVRSYKLLKEKHVKFELYDVRNGDVYDAIWFFGYKGQELPTRFRAVYEPSINVYNDREYYQLMIRHVEPELSV